MPVGERIDREFLGGRHGLMFEVWEDLEFSPTRTRRGARRAYLDAREWVVMDPGRIQALPGEQVRLSRIERSRVVEEVRIRIPGGAEPDGGVREPRRPRPVGGAGAAEADPGWA
jgi:hypothetical protein